MGAPLAGELAMSAYISFPTFNPDARDELKSSADELVNALWAGYQHASEFFRANPTPENWRTLVRSHACWRVAFMAEDVGDQP